MGLGSRCSELKPATTTNRMANHGIVSGAASLWAPLLPRRSHAPSINRNGASSITRSIFSITAAAAACALTARPATTTCATSWMVDPA